MILVVAALTQQELSSLPLIPWPAHVETRDASFNLNPTTVVVAKGREARENADYLRQVLGSTGLPLKGSNNATTNAIVLRIVKPADALGSEGYHLSVGKSEVDIEAATSAGLFYGIQTFRQLLPPSTFGTSTATGFTCPMFPGSKSTINPASAGGA